LNYALADLGNHFVTLPKAEPQIKPYRMSNELWWKTMTLEAVIFASQKFTLNPSGKQLQPSERDNTLAGY